MELDPDEFSFIWECLLEKITESMMQENSIHLTRLLALLISTLQNDNLGKMTGWLQVASIVSGFHLLILLLMKFYSVQLLNPWSNSSTSLWKLLLFALLP